MSGNSLRDQLSGLMQARVQQAREQAEAQEKKKESLRAKARQSEAQSLDAHQKKEKPGRQPSSKARLTPMPGLPVSQRAEEIIEAIRVNKA